MRFLELKLGPILHLTSGEVTSSPRFDICKGFWDRNGGLLKYNTKSPLRAGTPITEHLSKNLLSSVLGAKVLLYFNVII